MDLRITFGIIVLNGEPFTRFCIKSIYPYASEIIIVEGACEGARSVARDDGHSRDGTLENLRIIKKEADPDNKITIVTAEDEGYPDGFWPGEKHEQCEAFAKRTTGDYLWQVDIDEFYRKTDIESIVRILSDDNRITCIAFKQFGFWGGFDYVVDSWYFKRNLCEIYRIFKWDEGSRYVSHRPPTVLDRDGRNQKDIKFISSSVMAKMGIYMYHYSFIFPEQVLAKADYYTNSKWISLNANEWVYSNFNKITKPFRVFIIPDYPSWLKKFNGTHPETITELMNILEEDKTFIVRRDIDDIERLTSNWLYNTGIYFLILFEPVNYYFKKAYRLLKREARHYRNAIKSV